MSIKTEESDDAMLPGTQSGSLLCEEENSGENIGRGVVLKKGPWTSAEDAILLEYVKRHGEGNWNAVRRHSGLLRCGKSCRLRWANHLRPNLKKGTFTDDEERLIVELHAKMGNKWAQMAARLPGRTDNEIKNYWNTRIKRRLRAGLPLYPADVCLKVLQENQSLTSSGLNIVDKRYNALLQTNCHELAGSAFNGLNANYGRWPYVRQPSDMFSSTSLMKGPIFPQYYSFMPPAVLLSTNYDDIGNGIPQFDLCQDDPCNNDDRSFGLSFPYYPESATNYHSPFQEIQGSQSFLNGNSSASKPIFGAVKLELPSFQYTDSDIGSCGTSFLPPPLLESVDSFNQSEKSSTCNSGLLNDLVHEANSLWNAKRHSSDKSSDSSTVTPCDLAYRSTLNIGDTEPGEYSESISTFGHSASATSMFSECTPISGGGSSLSEYTRADIFPDCSSVANYADVHYTFYTTIEPANYHDRGHKVKSEPFDHDETPEGDMEVSTGYSSPSALFELDWLPGTKGQRHTSDTISSLLGSACTSSYMHY